MEQSDSFFECPVINSPYEYPARHWELAGDGQSTNQIIERRRQVLFITPIPGPKKRASAQQTMVFDEKVRRIATDGQRYELAQTINGMRNAVDRRQVLPDPGQRGVTPDTARLLVCRHQLQRGEPLRPTGPLAECERPLQGAQDHAADRDRPRRLGDLHG